MLNVPTRTKQAFNRNSIMTINTTDLQSVKNQRTLATLIKQSGPQQSMRSQSAFSQPQNTRPAAAHTIPSSARPSSNIQPALSSSGQMQAVQPAFSSSGQMQTVQSAFSSSGQTQNTVSISKPIPVLQNKVQKGQKAMLSSVPLHAVNACFGWNVTDGRCDVDVSAFLLGENGKVIGDTWFVFYGQTNSPDHSTKFIANSSKDREEIQIDFTRINSSVQKIVFVLTINDALKNRLHFGMLKDAYIRILDPSGKELVSFMMTDYYSNVISMMIGELYQHKGAWKFNAIGNGVAKDLAGLCALYGVQVV